MAKNQIKYDVSEMEKLIKCLKEDLTLRVGIIGTKATKAHPNENGKGDLTNAALGTIHEFGSQKKKDHPPRRSFLEDSLKFKLKFNEEQLRSYRNKLFTQFFIKKEPMQFMKQLGAYCLQIIQEGFDTNGFGMWKSYAESSRAAINRAHKIKKADASSRITTIRRYINFWTGRKILTETGKLRNSISFKILKNDKSGK